MLRRLRELLHLGTLPNASTGKVLDFGTTVPTDAADGYETGCLFLHTDGSAGTALYINEGSRTSCDFNPVETPGTLLTSDLADVGPTAYTAGKILVADGDSYEEVAVSGDATLASTGAATLNDAHAEQTAYVPVADLAAGADLSSVLVWAHPRACTLVSVGFFSAGSFGTVDDGNTAVFAVVDGADNAIVSKTYNTATQPSVTAINDLGALSATHKVLTASEGIKLAITNGASAATPAGLLVVRYIPTNA